MSVFEKSGIDNDSYSNMSMECSPCGCNFSNSCDNWNMLYTQPGLDNAITNANVRFGGGVSPSSI